MVVKDRQTMVIGGLIRDNVTSSTSKVPLLGDIPILGWLFKYKTTRIEKTNLMIFITPYIIKSEEEAAAITQRKNDSLENFRKEYHIEKKISEPNILPPKPAEKPAIQPAKSAEVKPAQVESSVTSTQPVPEMKPASEQKVESSVTSTQSSLPVASPAPETGAVSSGTTTQPPMVPAAPKEGGR